MYKKLVFLYNSNMPVLKIRCIQAACKFGKFLANETKVLTTARKVTNKERKRVGSGLSKE